MNHLLGIDMVHVPFKGGPPGAAEVASGNVDAMFVSPAAAMPHITAGRVVAGATGGAKRNPQFPSAPVLADTWRDFRVVSWFALFAPSRTPQRIVEQISRDATEMVRSPEVRALLVAQGINPVGGTPKQLTQLVRNDTRGYGETVQRIKLVEQ